MLELIVKVHAALNKNIVISVLCLILKPKRLSEVSKNFLILKNMTCSNSFETTVVSCYRSIITSILKIIVPIFKNGCNNCIINAGYRNIAM